MPFFVGVTWGLPKFYASRSQDRSWSNGVGQGQRLVSTGKLLASLVRTSHTKCQGDRCPSEKKSPKIGVWEWLFPPLSCYFDSMIWKSLKLWVSVTIRCEPWCWNIYLQNWAIFGVNEVHVQLTIPYIQHLGPRFFGVPDFQTPCESADLRHPWESTMKILLVAYSYMGV